MLKTISYFVSADKPEKVKISSCVELEGSVLLFFDTLNDCGSKITQLELLIKSDAVDEYGDAVGDECDRFDVAPYHTVSSLIDGQKYMFSVRAENEFGFGEYGESVTCVPG